MKSSIRKALATIASLGLVFAVAACGGSKENAVPSSPETSAQITIEGWEPLPRGSTDYVGVILSQELSEGDGAGSRLIVQKGIPSSQTAQTHADNLSFDLQQQGVDVKTLEGREINGEDAEVFPHSPESSKLKLPDLWSDITKT
ncbi:hypothetical protein QP228_000720 [Pseudoglutamicibacter cumminsii]|uniref:hypothetical protein n=1 Tax=Pseudoglutamicibacter cumminsii TaxID=156979 RepID=UPI002554B27D|nr:hypothetical protein [Pseudoglutamicibacter cumminsii]MDZ3744551.1 hypothetical protein [Pseudoglutamicibacter cumminsii]